jgi:hypothetical protein
VLVGLAARSGACVDVGGPRVVVAAAVGERADGVAQAVVAGPAEAGALALARLDGDRGLPGVGGERAVGRVAVAAVADLAEHGGGADRPLGVSEQRAERRPVDVVGQRGADLGGQLGDPGHQRFQRGDDGEHDLAARLGLELPGAAFGAGAQPCEQLAGAAAPAVVVAGEEALKALLAEPARVDRRRVALEEHERDRAVDLGEDPRRAGPELLELGAQLVGQRHARVNEVLTRARERAQRLGRVRVRHQHTEAVAVGAGQLGQHKRVKAVALAARRAKPRAHRGDLIGMDRDHPQTRVQQPLDQQPIRPLDRHQRDVELEQPHTQGAQPAFVMPVAPTLDDPPVPVDNADGVLLAGPIDASEPTPCHDHLQSTLPVAGDEVPWRGLIDGALTAQVPVAARGTSTDHRETQLSRWPSARARRAGVLPVTAGTPEDDQ